MTNRTLIAALLMGGAVLTGACSRTTRQNSLNTVPSAANNAPVTLQVTNNHPQDVDVYVAQGGDRWRLGTVTTAQTQNFTLPTVASRGGQIRVLLHPVGGGGDYSLSNVLVNPGDQVLVNVAPELPQSSFSVGQR